MIALSHRVAPSDHDRGDDRRHATPSAGETCDDSGESEACDIDCTLAECGDGVVNATAGEQCDGGADCVPGSCNPGTSLVTGNFCG